MSSGDNLDVLDLDQIMGDESEFGEAIDSLFFQCTGIDHGRFKLFLVVYGDREIEMTAGQALANLALLFPYHYVCKSASHRIFSGQMNDKDIEAHLNATVQELYDDTDPETLNRIVAYSTNLLSDIACAITTKVGTSISIYSLLEAAEKDPEIRRLINWTCPPGELGEIEKAADSVVNELVQRLTAINGNNYSRALRSGAIINKDQFRQAVVNIGVKPGLMDGELIAEPIDTSFLRGMRGVEDFYIASIGARKALTTNYRQVKAAGYLSRKMELLLVPHYINLEKDCSTIHGVSTVVIDDDHAQRLSGRMIKLKQEHQWEMTGYQRLHSLIGKQIILRSPVTCASEDGVCHSCYGQMAKSNHSIHAGLYAGLSISDQITQRLLSSKHLLKARPHKIAWPEEFLQSFSVERANVLAESQVDRIYVNQDDIEEDEEDGMRATATFYYKLSGSRTRFKVSTPTPIFLDEEAWGTADPDDDEISIQPQPESSVFTVPVGNSDLSEALTLIFSLIEREENSKDRKSVV